MRQDIISIFTDVLFWMLRNLLTYLYHDLVLDVLWYTEYVTEYDIIEMASWSVMTERDAPHEKRIRVGQP